MSETLVSARGLVKRFRTRGGWLGRSGPDLKAVDGVDLDVRAGETLGLVGESGSGKSTLGRLLIRLIEPDAGNVRFEDQELTALPAGELRRMRRHFQIIFQDPYGSLNPRMRVGSIIAEPLTIHRIGADRKARREKVLELLDQVGLEASAVDKYPHEFSGGQRQRIGIARAIACGPRFVVADEPVSALDPPVQAQILNLLMDLQDSLGLAYLFIAHDLRLVEHLCDRVAVMYQGRIVEQAPTAELFREPKHPYTRALLDSTPSIRPGEPTPPAVEGDPPSPTAPPPGCRFHPRCPVAVDLCSEKQPGLLPEEATHRVACHVAHETNSRVRA
ncbi:hypothetical protein ABI59_16800 [Acidobacteria bacterium Mor1]|nr:hypothetical protein ABI59_16800 [Acidobacteria bacterium Mor1]